MGYGAVESEFAQRPGGYRIFIVTSPDQLDQVGPVLYERAMSALSELGARQAWLIEYAEDDHFIGFLGRLGFGQVRRFRLESGVECVVLAKPLDAR